MKLVVILLFSILNVMNCKLEWRDCGPPDAILKVNDISIDPDPIVYLGKEEVKMDITFTKDVPVENLQLIVKGTKLTPYKMDVPCIKDFGSCTYDYCEYAKRAGKDLYGIFAPIQCPITANKYTLDLKDMQLPDVGDVYKKVIEGTFEANSKTGQIYGCLYGKFDIKLP